MTAREPSTPKAWANFLVRAWGADRFPVNVREVALGYSARYSDPISAIKEAPVGRTFEGALYPLPKSGKWAILYNPDASAGRINFTLAHELGHYLNHRHLQQGKGFECSQQRVLGYDPDAQRRILENEADAFASFLLMPIDDYRRQVAGGLLSADLLRHCADRYEVSLTAAALKWIEFTERAATLVYAIDGHVLWGRRSDAARRLGVYYPSGMELPTGSLAASGRPTGQMDSQSMVGSGVWHPTLPCHEMTIFADSYDATISILQFDPPTREYWQAVEPEGDLLQNPPRFK